MVFKLDLVENNNSLSTQIEHIIPGVIALLTALVLVIISILGPLGSKNIIYRTSITGTNQLIGQDLINLIFIAPICLIAGVLQLRKHRHAKFYLNFPGIYLVYSGLVYAIGSEWGNPLYDSLEANSHHFVWLFLYLSISGVILLIYSFSKFTTEDSPLLSKKFKRASVFFWGGLLSIFAIERVFTINEVIIHGTNASTTYSVAPMLFWMIKCFDLIFMITIGYLGIYLYLFHYKSAYGFVITTLGALLTMGIAVVSMQFVMLLNDDPLSSVFRTLFFIIASGVVISIYLKMTNILNKELIKSYLR